MGFFKSDPADAEKKALAEMKGELAARPNDVRVLMKLAELEHKLGQKTEAAEHYAQAAARYAEEGFLLKAVAVNKIAFGLTSDAPDLLEQEANFYAQLELIQDAFESLKKAIGMHDARGDKIKSSAARRKLLVIDPENAAGRVALAEHFVSQGKLDEALEQLAKVAAQLQRHDKRVDLERVTARVECLKKKLRPTG